MPHNIFGNSLSGGNANDIHPTNIGTSPHNYWYYHNTITNLVVLHYCGVAEFDKQTMQEYADGLYGTNSYMHPGDSVTMWFNNLPSQINLNTGQQQRLHAQTFNSVLPFVSEPVGMKAIMEASINSPTSHSINGRNDKTDGNIYSSCIAADLMTRLKNGDLLGGVCEVYECTI